MGMKHKGIRKRSLWVSNFFSQMLSLLLLRDNIWIIYSWWTPAAGFVGRNGVLREARCDIWFCFCVYSQSLTRIGDWVNVCRHLTHGCAPQTGGLVKAVTEVVTVIRGVTSITSVTTKWFCVGNSLCSLDHNIMSILRIWSWWTCHCPAWDCLPDFFSLPGILCISTTLTETQKTHSMRISEDEAVSPAFHRDFLSYLAAISKKKTTPPPNMVALKKQHIFYFTTSHFQNQIMDFLGLLDKGPSKVLSGCCCPWAQLRAGFPPRLMSTAVKEEPSALIHVRLCTGLTYNPVVCCPSE